MSNVSQFHFQNAIISDFPNIRKLLSQRTTSFIGPSKRKDYDPFFFFEIYSTHRIVARRNADDNDIVCFADFKHFPKILPLSLNSWPEWISHHYCIQLPMSKVNTLFLTYCVFNYTLNPELLINMLREVYFRERKLRYIVILEMPRVEEKFKDDEPNYEDFKSFSHVYYPKAFSVGRCHNTQRLYIIHRDSIIKKMRYRKALPEDNDEVVDVIDIDIPLLKKQYGEYYIAEEIMTNDPHKTFIITEINHITVGFFWLNKDVNITKLISNYELEPFGNLLNSTSQERSKKYMTHVTEIHRKDKSRLFRTEDIDKLFEERKSLPMQLDKDEWSSYASLDTISANAVIEPSKNNFLQLCWLPECFWRLQKLTDELKSTQHYYKNIARLMRVYYTSDITSQSNVFAMQLVGLHTSCDHREMFRFLIAAFSVHSNRDYCIFSLPVKWKMTPTVRELLRYFIPVLPRPGCEFDDLLFITHRSCLYGDITINNLTKDDIKPINAFLNSNKINQVHPLSSEASVQTDCPYDEDEETAFQKQLTEIKLISDIMEDVLHNPQTKYLFATIRVGNSAGSDAGNVVIGFVILRRFNFIHFLNEHFRIAPTHQLIRAMRYEMVCCRLHPLFLFESDMIFRELARVCAVFQILYLSPKSNKYNVLPNDLLPRMQPIQPNPIEKCKRKRTNIISYVPPDPEEPEINKIANFDYSKEYFSLYLHNLHSTKIFGSRRAIVIIGFSDMTKAILRLKLFEWNKMDFENTQRYCCIPHHNITVIANPGIVEGEFDVDFQCAHCADQSDCWINWWNSDVFIRDTVLRMDLQKYIKFVAGKVDRIDRNKKFVLLDNECRIHYDDLILVCDTKFGLPKPNFTLDVWPSNYQHINNRFDKIVIYHKLNIMLDNQCDENPFQILVYGKHLLAFEFIDFLTKHAIPSKCITMVFNMDTLDESDLLVSNPRHDYHIELKTQEMVEDMGVKVYEYCKFSHWILHENEPNIKSAVFEQPYKTENLTVDCDLFVSFVDVRMGHTMLKILEDNDFPTRDGKIIVDYAFRTSDPNIYAVGPCIDYEFETDLQLQNVNPKEMATKLLKSLETNPQNEDDFDTKYSGVAYCGICLPFGYKMAKVVCSRICAGDFLSNEYTRSLITYHDYEFCRVRLNRNNVVQAIVVITQKTLSLDFLKHFCGKHEALLNNLHSHWFIHSFDSFLDFFQEPWSELVQHESFGRLSKQNKELALVAAQQIINTRVDLSRKQRRDLLIKSLREGGVSSNVEENVLNFLRKYRCEMSEKFALPEDFPKAPDI